MKAKITGTTMPVLEIGLEGNDKIVAEPGEFSWMTDAVQMRTTAFTAGAKGIWGALGGIGGRLYRGEVSFDFVGRQRLWYSISGLFLALWVVGVVIPDLRALRLVDHMVVVIPIRWVFFPKTAGRTVPSTRSSIACSARRWPISSRRGRRSPASSARGATRTARRRTNLRTPA